MVDATPHQFCFGRVSVRPAQRLVLVDGQPAPLGARALDVLVTLIEHRDRVVTKDELLEWVWPGLVVEENNLQVQISALRKLLGPQAITTVPSRGYRFTAVADESSQATASPAATGSAPLGNVPASLPALVGRDEEMTALTHLVRAHRVVTVVGAGGIGKTQLALAAAHALRAEFAHGVWLVDLASVADPALVGSAVAQALALSLPGARSQLEALTDALRGREMLLLLDNCEHLVEAVSSLTEALVARTALVRVLATSQELLRVADEHLYRIAPLTVPSTSSLEGAGRASAVALFVERVRALQGGFALDAHNVAAVADICRRLDGLPLAIELAAARTPLLGVLGVHERLHERFRILTGGSRAALRRHQTLREMLDWSFGLLNDQERAVFMRAGVFVGSFSIEAAQEVLVDERMDPWALLDHLGGLVDKSLVVVDAGDLPRYRLLESMRAYALERLREAGQTEPLLHRHALAVQRTLTRLAAECWTVPSQIRLAQAMPDLDNIRAAISWAQQAAEQADLHMTLAGASEWLWALTGLRLEGLKYLDAAVDRIGPQTPADVEAPLLAGWARLRYPRAGQQELAAVDRAIDLFRVLGDPRTLFIALWIKVLITSVTDDLKTCRRAAEELEALHDPVWPPVSRWEVLSARIKIRWFTDHTRVLDVIPELQECLRLAENFGDANLRADALLYLEQTAQALGRFDEAVDRGRELVDHLRRTPFARSPAIALANLCLAQTEVARLDEALETGREALQECRRQGTMSLLLDAAALLAFKRGQVAQAAQTLGRAEASMMGSHRVREPNEVRAHSATLAGLQAALPAVELERLLKAGAQLTDDQAAALALVATG